jgi:hypothetical protein
VVLRHKKGRARLNERGQKINSGYFLQQSLQQSEHLSPQHLVHLALSPHLQLAAALVGWPGVSGAAVRGSAKMPNAMVNERMDFMMFIVLRSGFGFYFPCCLMGGKLVRGLHENEILPSKRRSIALRKIARENGLKLSSF